MIVSWHAPRYDRMTEWQARNEALVGDTSHLTYEDAMGGVMDAAAWSHYANLSIAQLDQIQKLYGHFGGQNGAKWLITTGHYPFRVAYQAKSYFVYELPPDLHS
jgi:hypothetical protein